jgi:hypothetical protein
MTVLFNDWEAYHLHTFQYLGHKGCCIQLVGAESGKVIVLRIMKGRNVYFSFTFTSLYLLPQLCDISSCP